MQAQLFKSWRPIFIPTKRKTSAIVQVSRTFGKYSLESITEGKTDIAILFNGLRLRGHGRGLFSSDAFCRDEGFGAS
jgi:hypothetical protein